MNEPRDSLPTHEHVREAKVAGYDNRRRYGKIQGDWEENGGDPRALARWCKRDGTGVSGDPFYIYYPRLREEATGYDPEVYEDDIVSWRYDVEGTRIGEDTRWSKIGQVRVRDDRASAKGWHPCDGTVQHGFQLLDFRDDGEELQKGGRFMKQRVSPESVGDHGGLKQFMVSNIDPVSQEDGTVPNVDGIDEEGMFDVDDPDKVENRPPYTCVEIEQRFK